MDPGGADAHRRNYGIAYGILVGKLRSVRCAIARNESVACGQCSCFPAVSDIELAKEASNVIFNGPSAKGEPVGHLRIREALA